MQLSKNALGNLINRYKAVLKKCHLLNTFGTLAVASCFGLAALGAICAPMQAGVAHAAGGAPAFTPTLDREETKAYLGTLTKDDGSGTQVPVYTPEQIANISSAYSIEVTVPGEVYFKTFTVQEAGNAVTYGISLKGLPNVGNVEDLIEKAITSNDIPSAQGSINPYDKIELVARVEASGSAPDASTYTFKVATTDASGAVVTLYFAVKNGTSVLKATGREQHTSGTYTYNQNFIGNTASSDGGGMYNNASSGNITITSLTGDFVGNTATDGGGMSNSATGGNITITTLIGDFVGNTVNNGNGGGMYNSVFSGATLEIDTLTGDFVGNTARSGGGMNNSAFNGATLEIGTLTGDFVGNTVGDDGGGMSNSATGGATLEIGTLTGDFVGNTVGGDGGGMYNSANGGNISITTLTGDFVGNTASNGTGGSMYNLASGGNITIGTFTGDVVGNTVINGNGGGLRNTAVLDGTITIGTITGDFVGNSAVSTIQNVSGGAMYNNISSSGGSITIGSISGSFRDNFAITDNASRTALGGAIWTNTRLSFKADGQDYVISGNYTQVGSAPKDYNAIYIDGTSQGLTFDLHNGGSYTLNDNVKSSNEYAVAIRGNRSGDNVFYLNNILHNVSRVTLSNATLSFDAVFHDSIKYTGSIGSAELTVSGISTLHNAGISDNVVTFESNSNVTLTGDVQLGTNFINNSSVLNVGTSTTTGTLDLAADKSLSIESGQTFNINKGFLALSGTGVLQILSGGTANIYTDISLGSNFSNNGTTTFKGVTTLNGIINTGSIIADGATFTNEYTEDGSITALNTVTFTNGYSSGATLNVGNANTAGDVTLAANQNMTIKSGGALNVINGTLDVSGGTLTVDSGASTFATGTNGTLTAKASDFGTFGADGSFSRDGTDNVQKSLDNAGHLILTDTGYGVIAKDTYKELLANATLFGSGRGTINFKDVTLSSHYSLNDVENQYGLDQELMAGTLGGAGDNKNVSTSGIIANTIGAPGAKATDSSIKSGSTLSLRGNNTGNILLDEGSLTNEGTLNLGTAGATYSANFNGTLTTNGETTVLSHVIFDGAVTSGGTTVIENGAAFNAGLVVAGGTTTLKDSITGTSTVSNGTLLVDAAGSVTTGDIVLSTDGELEVVSGTLNMTADLTFNGGTLRSTSHSASGDIAQATAVFLPDLPSNFDGNIIVEQNAYTVLGGGDRAYAEKAFGESKHSWGTGVTAALFIAAPQSLASTGSIKVDGSNTQLSAADSNNAVFKSNSLLVVDASGIGTSAAITATDGVLTVESSAKLHITGAVSDSILTIVDGFSDGTSSVAAGSWEGDNLTTSTSLQVADVIDFDSATGSYKVEVSAATPDDLRTIYQEMTEETAKLLVGVDPNDVDSYFAALLSDKLGKNAPKETTLRSEALLRIAQMAGVQSSGLNVGKSFFANVLRRMASFGLGGFAPQSQQLKKEQGIPSGSSVEGEGLSAGQNGQGMKNGVALWISPLYQYSNVHGVDVGAFKNGYETGLGGLTLGADYTFNDIFRVGLAFNVGAGYTESTGDFYNTNNDFDFWGLSLYGGLSKDNFTLMADVGYSSVFGELSQDTAAGLGFSTLKADTQSDVWTLGLTAAYTFKTDFMDITPHAGVRYMNVTTYGFDTKSNGVVQTHTAETSQDVWYFPVGVTFSKDIVSQSGWIFTPKLDLGFIAAAGDLDARSVTSIPGVAGSAEYTMKNVDGFAFNGGLGFDLAHKENGVSVGVNYNVQASEHETSHMIFANFRYEF